MSQSQNKRGYVVVSVLVFSAIFLMILSSLVGYVFIQNRTERIKEAQQSAFQIAEAGLNYYRWYLSHYPDDLQNGTGSAGPYVMDYEDPEGGVIGKFELTINGNQECGVTNTVSITSKGWTTDEPSYTRTVYGKYARPSVAKYSFILNSNVWAGEDRVIRGPYHSNGGIRMDGTSDSKVTSGVEDWECTDSFGCSSGGETKPGIFGDGEDANLWEYPVTPVDFTGITLDLSSMKSLAQSNGLYFKQVNGNERRGYHLIFKPDGTLDVYNVRKTDFVQGYHSDDSQWYRDYHIIDREDYVGNYDIPDDCSVVFVEDKVWVEGEVHGKVTLAAADVTGKNYDPDVILSNNLTYTNDDGSDGITVIAENSVLIPLISPNEMEINGIFIAQKGYYGRNHYPESWYPTYAKRDFLKTVGTFVSNGRVGTKWSCGGSFCSGYENRENSYDRDLATDPPPLTPNVGEQYEFVEWREVE